MQPCFSKQTNNSFKFFWPYGANIWQCGTLGTERNGDKKGNWIPRLAEEETPKDEQQ